jgi:hypothetical protein
MNTFLINIFQKSINLRLRLNEAEATDFYFEPCFVTKNKMYRPTCDVNNILLTKVHQN